MARATKHLAWAALAILATVGTPAAAASAAAPPRNRPIHIVEESAVYHRATSTVSFAVTFDRTPNFRRVDEFGRRANSFQYFVVGDDTLPGLEKWDAIIRGDERSLTSGVLPIRNSSPLDPAPEAGGWGTIRATVPSELRGRLLTFSAPLTAVSDHSTNGAFAYSVETYTFGALVDRSESHSIVPSG